MTKDLPVLAKLYNQEQIEKIQMENDLNILLNQEPNKKWIKSNPMAKGSKYIPIEIIEYLLTSIFINWWVEIKKSEIMANSVVITVTLHYMNPVDSTWRKSDGIGASPIQTDSGALATDFTKVKNFGVMMSAPAAESFAIKDAAEKLGKLFGKDLNRKDAMTYESLSKKVVKQKELPELTPESDEWADVLDGLREYPNRKPSYYETWFVISDKTKQLLISQK